MRVVNSQRSLVNESVFCLGAKRLELQMLKITFQLKDFQTRYATDSAVVGQKRLAVTHQCGSHLDRIGRLEFARCSELCRDLEEAAINFDKPQTSAMGQQRLVPIGKGGIARPIRCDQDFHQTETGCHRREIAAIDRFKQRLYKRKVTAILLYKVDKMAYRGLQGRAQDRRSVPLAPFPVYVFSGVNLFPDVLSKPLELQNGERSGTFRRRAENMNNFLRNRPMLALCACLNLSVQAIGHVLDIEDGHKCLQNASSMEETGKAVKEGH
jgi:hypothetical protein